MLYTGSADSTIKFWQLGEGGQTEETKKIQNKKAMKVADLLFHSD